MHKKEEKPKKKKTLKAILDDSSSSESSKEEELCKVKQHIGFIAIDDGMERSSDEGEEVSNFMEESSSSSDEVQARMSTPMNGCWIEGILAHDQGHGKVLHH